jgi:GH24 family phage-related lysozyme (muramidase)
MEKINIYIIIFFSLIHLNFNTEYKQYNSKNIKSIEFNITNSKKEYNIMYDSVITFIKLHESFRSKKYHTGIDTDNYSIGYGHLIKEGEEIPEIISEGYATQLLKKDLNESILLSTIYSPILIKNKYKQLAIGHFIFAKGIGNYNKSTLKILVDNNKDISEEIITWCIITQTTSNINYYKNKYEIVSIKGNTIKYKHPKMIENRMFELNIYNK